jgi:hypothetical protein
MKREFSYFRRGDQCYPMIDVELIGSRRRLVVKALIDSGATFSLFRPEIADYLGIEVSSGRSLYFYGIKGKIFGYLHKIPVKVNQKRFDCYIAFSPELEVPFNILGRNNFFFPFLITFNEKHQTVIIEKNNLGKKQ